MNKVLLFKLINGEFVIGKVIKGSEDNYEVSEPAVLLLRETEGKVGAEFVPFMPYSKAGENVNIFYVSVAGQGVPDESLEKAYLAAFHPSGIILPTPAESRIVTK